MKKNNFAVKILILTLVMMFISYGVAFAGVPHVSDSFYVADYADVISTETENYIIEKNAVLEDLSGAQIVVAAVDFLDGMDIEDYAYKMFNEWEIGDKDENNGVLLLLVIGEENYWCMQGRGLERVLTSGDIDDILWYNLEPGFARANYDEGIRQTFDALYNELNTYYGGSAEGNGSEDGYANDYDNSYDGRGSSTKTISSEDIKNVVKIIFVIFAVIVILVTALGIFLEIDNVKNKKKTPTWTSGNSTNSNPWNPTTRKPTNYPSSPRPVIFPLMGGMTSRPKRRSTTTNTSSGGLFGSLFSGGSSHSHSSFGGSSHSSFGGGSHGIGRGGGGSSRGGGAGRRR